MQGGIARFFFSFGYHSSVAIANYVSRRLADIVGVQYSPTKKPNTEFIPTKYSPNYRARKAQEDLRSQVMNLSGGNIVEFNELMRGDVSTYLLKFEMSIKQTKKDGIG